MCKDDKFMHCIVAKTVREIVHQANELEIPRENIFGMFVLREQVYLIYYK